MKHNMQKIVIGVLMIYMLIGCSKQNEVPDSTTKLLHVIVESPNEELYHAQPTEIGIGIDVPDEEEIDATQKVVEEEKTDWNGAVGDCFAKGMFDTFWNSQERICFLGASDVNGCQTSVKKIELVEKNDNIHENISEISFCNCQKSFKYCHNVPSLLLRMQYQGKEYS